MLVCLPLAAPIGLSLSHIPTLCGCEHVLVPWMMGGGGGALVHTRRTRGRGGGLGVHEVHEGRGGWGHHKGGGGGWGTF